MRLHVPSHGLAGHDPEDVLNHRLGSNGKLLPDVILMVCFSAWTGVHSGAVTKIAKP